MKRVVVLCSIWSLISLVLSRRWWRGRRAKKEKSSIVVSPSLAEERSFVFLFVARVSVELCGVWRVRRGGGGNTHDLQLHRLALELHGANFLRWTRFSFRSSGSERRTDARGKRRAREGGQIWAWRRGGWVARGGTPGAGSRTVRRDARGGRGREDRAMVAPGASTGRGSRARAREGAERGRRGASREEVGHARSPRRWSRCSCPCTCRPAERAAGESGSQRRARARLDRGTRARGGRARTANRNRRHDLPTPESPMSCARAEAGGASGEDDVSEDQGRTIAALAVRTRGRRRRGTRARSGGDGERRTRSLKR